MFSAHRTQLALHSTWSMHLKAQQARCNNAATCICLCSGHLDAGRLAAQLRRASQQGHSLALNAARSGGRVDAGFTRKASPSRQESIAPTPGKHRPNARTASPSRQDSIDSDLPDPTSAQLSSAHRTQLALHPTWSMHSGLSKHAATTLPHASAIALDISMLAGLLLNSDVRRSKGIG